MVCRRSTTGTATAGSIVLAVPSDDFRQELGSEAEVKEFCALNYGLDLPMTEITHVTGGAAHPFFRWVADTTGFVPGWNFNKVLVGPVGRGRRDLGVDAGPLSGPIVTAIEAALGS